MMEYIENYIKELWFLVQEMAPWLLLGLIFAGLLKVYFPQKHIDKYLGKRNFKSALNAALLGIPMPLCSCGVIPTGISFYKDGASKGATNSFLISTPQTGVDSIFATYSMLGWPFAVLRPLVAFVTGVVGGVLTNVFVKEKPKPQVAASPFASFKIDTQAVNGAETCNDASCGCHEEKEDDNRPSLVRAADYAFVELLQDIAKWLLIGFMLAALISVLLPNDFFSRFQGWGILEILLILAASVPIYICATGSIPVAAVLLMKGVSPGAALVFLMAGPATNVATMTVLGKTMGKRSLAVYMATITGGAVLFGLLTNWLFPADFILSKVMHIHGDGGEHSMLPQWLELASAVLLIGSIIGGYFWQKLRKKQGMKAMEGVTIHVEGMTCSHCEASVKRNLESIRGIKSVMADNSHNTVKILGSGYKMDKVKETIEQLGYKYIG
ncbi:SO_0444 family Cu/Zn efflux transporter [Maribellus sp. YY47]|uniref:SO_0444 family Cu/Zn efflux transporter n=1 Tax=Maribellus sp. YY47 TaxID=2929486 RepID=UPI0020013698|nr:SO_0444 family Cu/Zn efflux transporter [Maribellus sp. YY47]MCK3684411.1 SO_0444 family Cu/Zn efflux transporter [Maribellus sp. YY47]